jgi:hypothetical protein
MDLHNLAQSISALLHHAVVQRLLQILLTCKEHDRTLLYILLALAVGFVIGRYRASRAYRVSAYQNRGEALLSRVVLTNFGPPDYHLMNHVTLQMKDGTTQVDHILISRFGVFVIETKDYKGWIFANATQANWTQVLFNFKFKFQNPIFQNMRHVRAVQGLLDFLPPGAIKSVVVFTGEAKFKTEIPEGVFTISGFFDYLRDHTVEVMPLIRVQFCVGRLETARLAISGQTDVEHVQSLERRHGSAATRRLSGRPETHEQRLAQPDRSGGRVEPTGDVLMSAEEIAERRARR